MSSIERTVDPNLIYEISPGELGHGNYAQVVHATHRKQQDEVALKRAWRKREAFDRIKQEIETQKKLAHPNIMPIGDHDPGYRWYTMPVANGTLRALRNQLTDEDLESILYDLSNALAVAHEQTLIHRDISPQNILALDGNDDHGYRWVIADWGMVRALRKSKSWAPTRTGQQVGTPGYAAPELEEGPDSLTPAADVYSLGRVAAWFLTQQEPRPGEDLLPEEENQLHWRPFLRSCTQRRVADRVQNMTRFTELLREVASHRDEPVAVRARRLSKELMGGDHGSVKGLVALADSYSDHADLYLDHIARIPTNIISDWVFARPNQAAQIGTEMCEHVVGQQYGDRDPQYVETPLSFVLGIMRLLTRDKKYALLQDVAMSYFKADVHWADIQQRTRTIEWLSELDERAGQAIASELALGAHLVAYYRTTTWRSKSRALTQLLATNI